MTGVILFVFGAIVGSFLNVAALRLRSGLSLGGRSHCSSCGKKLGVRELVPVLSFLFLNGRCRSCRARISWQYPAVEVLTGLVFLSIFNLPFPIFNKIIILLVFCIYITISVYDLRHKIIPDSLAYSAILLSILSRWLSVSSALDWLAGPILALFIGGLWFFSRGRAMGLGDAKLVLSVGFLLGAAQGFSALILAFWLGALWGLSLILSTRINPLLSHSKRITIKSELPFAPFIILGAWLALVSGLDLLHVASF